MAIPKSVNPDRIRQNLDVEGFTLSSEDLGRIDALDMGSPSGPEPEREFDDSMLFPIPEA